MLILQPRFKEKTLQVSQSHTHTHSHTHIYIWSSWGIQKHRSNGAIKWLFVALSLASALHSLPESTWIMCETVC